MERERPRPPRETEDGEPEEVPQLALRWRPRDRVRQALLCPYCRDDVKGRTNLACGRRECGATYHRECWEECVSLHGSCALLGCGSTRASEVSRWGYLLRVLRLLLAVLLIPPRLARSIREQDQRGTSLLKVAHERSKWLLQAGPFLSIPVGVPLSYLLPWVAVRLITGSWQIEPLRRLLMEAPEPVQFLVIVVWLIGSPFLLALVPYLLSVLIVTCFELAKRSARLLGRELTVLYGGARQPEGRTLPPAPSKEKPD